MKEANYITVKTYDAGDGFLLEEQYNSDEDLLEYWIYHKDYGVKQHIYGIHQSTGLCFDSRTSHIDRYKRDYRQSYMDE
jgi:hypothetical protein